MNTRGSGMSQLSLSRFEKVQGFDGAFTPEREIVESGDAGGVESQRGFHREWSWQVEEEEMDRRQE